MSSEPALGSPAESSGSTESMETSPPPATSTTVPRDSSQSSSEALMDTDGTTGTIVYIMGKMWDLGESIS